MKSHPLTDLTIRTAIVRGPNLGNILACDLKREEADDSHAYIFKWQAGTFTKTEANFDAHSICKIKMPEAGLVFINSGGAYGVHYKGGAIAGDIPGEILGTESDIEGFRSVTEIDGKAYAVGFGGNVYRLDKVRRWTSLSEGLPESFSIEACHGFAADNIYAAGDDGEFWHFNGKKWRKLELPTNANLSTILCAPSGIVYIGGQSGALLQGRGDTWSVIDVSTLDDDIWDLEWFENILYVSTLNTIYTLTNDLLIEVDFGKVRPKTCYQLSTAEGTLWSNGEYDIVAFDGRRWTRIV